jgi:hypothetical protein
MDHNRAVPVAMAASRLSFPYIKAQQKDFLKNKISRMLIGPTRRKALRRLHASQWAAAGLRFESGFCCGSKFRRKGCRKSKRLRPPGWAPVWGEAPKKNGADRRGAGDFGTRRKAETAREAESERESQRRKENDRRDGAYGSEQGGEPAERGGGTGARAESKVGLALMGQGLQGQGRAYRIRLDIVSPRHVSGFRADFRL